MKAHKCKEARYCICSVTALEPDEDCPVHGNPHPPRCGICGRFLPYKAEWEAYLDELGTVE